MKNIGNIKANQNWNPDEIRHPPPTNMEESERDSELEKYIRCKSVTLTITSRRINGFLAKYEYKRFRDISKRVAEQLGPSQSKAAAPARSRTAPINCEPAAASPSSAPTVPPSSSQSFSSTPNQRNFPFAPAQQRSVSVEPLTSPGSSNTYSISPSSTSYAYNTAPVPLPGTSQNILPKPSALPNQQASLTSSTFNDLISLQTPSLSSSLPLQYQQTNTFSSQPAQFILPSIGSPMGGSSNPYTPLSISTNPITSFPSQFDRPQNSLGANLPMYGQMSPIAGTPLNTTPINPFQQGFASTASPSTTSPPNPFTQMYAGSMAGMSNVQPQPYIAQSFTPQTQQLGGTPQPAPSPFRQTPSPFTTQSGGVSVNYQPPAGGLQPTPVTGSINAGSPYSQQAQQAQKLFQSMAGGNNPFGTQWNTS